MFYCTFACAENNPHPASAAAISCSHFLTTLSYPSLEIVVIAQAMKG